MEKIRVMSPIRGEVKVIAPKNAKKVFDKWMDRGKLGTWKFGGKYGFSIFDFDGDSEKETEKARKELKKAGFKFVKSYQGEFDFAIYVPTTWAIIAKEFLQEIAEEVLNIHSYIEEGESEKLDRVLEDTKNIYLKILKKTVRGE